MLWSIKKLMRYLIIVLLVTFFSGCQPEDKTIHQRIFDEYLFLHFVSWNSAIGEHYVPEFDHKAGDTIQLDFKLSMFIVRDDTTVIDLGPENHLQLLDSGTTIVIRKILGNSTWVDVSIKDTICRGIISNEDFLNAQSGESYLDFKRKNLIETLKAEKKEGLKAIALKYKLSEDSLLKIIAKEYYLRTGSMGINY
jgi:hypothetical protein